ncbi:MAG: glycerophosphodiester phosphodiesterase [Clostridia bacterium]|nr:glycerophosphodiester phosphodiesterase [Clostridia bacterium]
MIYLFITLGSLALIYLALVFFFGPTGRKHPDLPPLKGAMIAHRGLHSASEGICENSLSAFRRAIENGLPIEIDIHLTCDGKVVVFHDHKLQRMCGVEGRVEEMTLKELRSLRLKDTDEQIPTLSECLNLVAGKVPLLIEFKAKKNHKALCRTADAILSRYKGSYLIQSFYPQVLLWYRLHRKKVCRGQLAARFKKKGFLMWLQGTLFFNFLARPDFIAYRHDDYAFPMRRFCVWLGAASFGWTFQKPEEIEERKKDFDTYIFENFVPTKP